MEWHGCRSHSRAAALVVVICGWLNKLKEIPASALVHNNDVSKYRLQSINETGLRAVVLPDGLLWVPEEEKSRNST